MCVCVHTCVCLVYMCAYMCVHVRLRVCVCVVERRKELLEGSALYPQKLVNLALLRKDNWERVLFVPTPAISLVLHF